MRIQIHGLREIQTAMRELPRRVDRKILNDGLITGARQIRDAARAHVPLLRVPDARRIRGTLQRAIVAGRVRPQAPYAASVWVRVRALTKRQIATFKRRRAKRGLSATGANNPRDAFYWFFVEFGTSKMAARPFMRPAFESRKHAAVATAIGVFRERVQAEIARLRR